MCSMARHILSLHEHLHSPQGDREGVGFPQEVLSDLAGQISEGYSSGRPVVRCLRRDSHAMSDLMETVSLDLHHFMDCFSLVGRLLHEHVCDMYSLENIGGDSDVHLPRNEAGLVDLEELKKRSPRSRLLLDRIFNGYITADMELRREHLRKRVMVIKTLWDVSTTFRARRMNSIIRRAWPEIQRGAKRE